MNQSEYLKSLTDEEKAIYRRGIGLAKKQELFRSMKKGDIKIPLNKKDLKIKKLAIRSSISSARRASIKGLVKDISNEGVSGTLGRRLFIKGLTKNNPTALKLGFGMIKTGKIAGKIASRINPAISTGLMVYEAGKDLEQIGRMGQEIGKAARYKPVKVRTGAKVALPKDKKR